MTAPNAEYPPLDVAALRSRTIRIAEGERYGVYTWIKLSELGVLLDAYERVGTLERVAGAARAVTTSFKIPSGSAGWMNRIAALHEALSALDEERSDG